MAQIVVTSTKYNVAGSMRDQFYNGCTFASGDTLIVGMNSVKRVDIDAPSTTTAVTYSVAAATPSPGQSTITFTTSAPVTAPGINIEVIGN